MSTNFGKLTKKQRAAVSRSLFEYAKERGFFERFFGNAIKVGPFTRRQKVAFWI